MTSEPTQKKQKAIALDQIDLFDTAEEVAQIGSWSWDLKTQKVTWSNQMFRLFGVEKEGFDGDVNRIIAERVHPDDLPHVMESNRSVLEEETPRPLSYRILLPDGTERMVWAQGKLIRDEKGQLTALTGYVQDVTERVRAEAQILQLKRLYATLSQVNQTIVRVKEPGELYRSICDMVVKFGEFSLAWVGLLEEATGEIKPVAAHGMDIEHWSLPIINIQSEQFKNHLVTQAIHTGMVVTSADVQTDPRLTMMRNFIKELPYHAVAVVPFNRGGKVVGILVIVSPQAGFFKAEEELSLLAEMGLDISFALDKMESDRIKRQWADAFEHAAHGMVIADVRTSHILACNPAFAREQGGTIQELIGMPILDMYRPEDHARIKQLIAQSDREGTVQFEAIKVRKDGSTYPFQLDVVSVRDENGNLLYRVASQQDITERRKREADLKEAQEWLLLAHEAADIGLWQNDLLTGTVRFDDCARRHYGFETYDTTLQDVFQRVHPDDAERLGEEFAVAVSPEGKGWLSTEYRVIHPNGDIHWLAIGVRVWFEEEGKSRRAIKGFGTTQDITERKKAEQALRKSERTLQLFVEHAPASIAMFDREMKYIATSRRFLLDYGLGEQNVIGRSHYEIFPEMPERWNQIHQRCLQGAVEKAEEDPFPRADGHIDWVRWEIHPWFDDTGKIGGIILFSEVITDKKEAEIGLSRYATQLEEAEKFAKLGSWEFEIATGKGWWSKQMYRMFGFEISDTVPDYETYLERIHPEDRHLVQDVLIEMTRGEEPPLQEYRSNPAFGPLRYLSPTTYTQKDKAGNPIRFIGTLLDITERKRAEREIQQRNIDLTLIMSLNEAANRGEDMETIIKSFLHNLCELFGGEDADIFLLSPDKKYLEMSYTTTSRSLIEKIETLLGASIPKIRIPLSNSPFLKSLLANKQGTILNDPQDIQQYVTAYTETTFLPSFLRPTIKALVPKIFGLLKIRSNISVPMISNGEAIGLLDIANSDFFTEEDLARVHNITNQMTSTILRKRAEMNVKRQLRRITALNEIDRAISASLDMRLSLDVLLGEVITQLEVDAAAVLLLNPVDQHLEFTAGRGFRTPAITKSRMQLGQGFAGTAGLERKVVHVGNLSEAGKLFVRAGLLKDENFIEYFGVPLIAKGVLKGVLEIFNRTPLAADADWLHYLETLGGQAAIAVDNAQLLEAIQQTNQELISAYDATIAGWSHAMDLRDKETEGHTQRVTETTVQLAERMGISKQEQVQIRRGALLHDIGKLGVPDHILLKPGKLTDEEWLIMRQHPTYAYEMLLPIHYLRPALDIPYCHHEKWDGSGYPRKLKGEEIPLAARIFAVVDVWDALRSDRPYRAGWSAQETRDYILAESGKHFDPQVVAAFMNMIGMK